MVLPDLGGVDLGWEVLCVSALAEMVLLAPCLRDL